MQRIPRPEKPDCRRWPVAGLFLVLCTLNLAGCQNTNRTTKPAGDPLLGEVNIPAGNVPPNPRTSAITPAKSPLRNSGAGSPVNYQGDDILSGGIPPLPSLQGSASNAALASLPGEKRTLAINPNQPVAPATTTSFPRQTSTTPAMTTANPSAPGNHWSGATPPNKFSPPDTPSSTAGSAPAGPAPSANTPALSTPPITNPGNPAGNLAPPPSVGSLTPATTATPKVMAVPHEASSSPILTTGSFSAAQQTQEILQTQLKARGVQWQKSEVVPEGIRFSCIAPSRSNPESSRIYEAVAPDYASAVQAVLLQIDRET